MWQEQGEDKVNAMGEGQDVPQELPFHPGSSSANLKVIGVGGGGCNAVNDMLDKGFKNTQFYAMNTDFQALNECRVPNKIGIGIDVTHGLGAGSIPEFGEEAARKAEDEIRKIIDGADMVFIAAGMGGGTGTGAAPVIAEIAKSMGILSVAVVTKPFPFEGQQRMRRANQGIQNLRKYVDTMIIILNEKVSEVTGPKASLLACFKEANTVLGQAIFAITDLVSRPGLINVDLRDIRTIMSLAGGAVMGVGTSRGENRALDAVKRACQSPLQEKIVIDDARGVLINITGGPDIGMQEVTDASNQIYNSANPEANIVFGVVIDEEMKEEIRVTIIATGFQDPSETQQVTETGPDPVKPREKNFAVPQQPTPIARPATPPPPTAPVLETPTPESNPLASLEPKPAPAAPYTPAAHFSTPVNTSEPMTLEDPMAQEPNDDPYDITNIRRPKTPRTFE